MNLTVNDDGIYNTETYTVSCEEAVLAGRAAALVRENIVIGYDRECQTCFHALASGIMSQGKKLWDAGICTQAQLRFCIRESSADCGIFIENCCGNKKLLLFSSGGHTLTSEEEMEFTEAINESRTLENVSSEGQIISADVLSDMYFTGMKQKFISLKNCNIKINSSSRIIRDFALENLPQRNCSPETVTFSIPGNGLRASAYSDETGCVFWEKLVLICCNDEFEKGKDMALPCDFPVIAEKTAASWNRIIYRYDPSSSNLSDVSKKEMSLEFPFLTDGLYLAARIAWIMHTRCCTFASLLRDIPEFTTTVKYVKIHGDPAEKIRRIRENEVCCRSDSGRIVARKSKSGKSLVLYAESYSTESADELCSSWIRDLDI